MGAGNSPTLHTLLRRAGTENHTKTIGIVEPESMEGCRGDSADRTVIRIFTMKSMKDMQIEKISL